MQGTISVSVEVQDQVELYKTRQRLHEHASTLHGVKVTSSAAAPKSAAVLADRN